MPFENEQIPAAGGAPDTDLPSDDFDAALDELMAAEAAPADQAAAGEAPVDADDKSAAEAPAPASNEAAANADAADANGSPADTPTDDIWANAPPALRKAYEDLQRDSDLRVKSLQGRQSALDRELQRLRNQPGQQQEGQRQSPPQQPAGNPNGREAQDETLAQLREEYPELAGPLIDLIEAQKAEIAGLKTGVEAFNQTQAHAHVSTQEALLTERHPDWNDVVRDDRFGGWLQSQPRSVQDAFNRNVDSIVDGEDAALVVGLFKTNLGIGSQPTSQGQSEPAPTPPPPPARDERRERQMNSGRDFGRAGPPVATGIAEDDFDGAVDYFMSKAAKG